VRIIWGLVASAGRTLESLSFGCLDEDFAKRKSRNSLMGEGAVALGTVLGTGRLPRLACLNLSACGIAAAEIAALMPGLSHPSARLVSLDFSANNFGDASFEALTHALPRMPGIKCLDVGGNRLSNEALQRVCTALCCLPGLTHVRLSGIGGIMDRAATAALVSALRSTSSLLKLDICRNAFSPEACVMGALAGLPLLEELHIGGSGLQFASLRHTPRLKQLVVMPCVLKDAEAGPDYTLSSHLGSLASLQVLDLNFSAGFASGVDIAACISAVPQLKVLRIHKTWVREATVTDFWTTIAHSLSALSQLEDVRLSTVPRSADDVLYWLLMDSLPASCSLFLNGDS
jgi:hypothetical protein